MSTYPPGAHTGRPTVRHADHGRVLVLCPVGHLVQSVAAGDWTGSALEAQVGDPTYLVTCTGAAPAALTITHTRAEGTLLEGTARGDGSAAALRGTRFRWSRNLGAWYLPQSRDRAAKTWEINTAAEALRAAGFTVTVTVDDTVARPFAEAEAERNALAEARAERHAEYAGNAAARADAAYAAEHNILKNIPPGQPILEDHYSAPRHRRDLQRAESHRQRGSDEARKAQYWANRADAADGYQKGRENIPTTLRRIDKLEAELRGVRRNLDGHTTTGLYGQTYQPASGEYRTRLEAEAAALAEEITYWRGVVAAAEQAGVKVWGKPDFNRGDFALYHGTWWEVLRVNTKSVTIPGLVFGATMKVARRAPAGSGEWTNTLPYDNVQGRKTAAEMAAWENEGSR